MSVTDSLGLFELPTPPTSTIGPDTPDMDSVPRRPRQKRRLTAPADLQLGEKAVQVHKKSKLVEGRHAHGIRITEEVDELIPRFQAMGGASSLYTPKSSGFDSAFVPFVLDDGVLSFYTPTDSSESSDIEHSSSLPSSAVSTSFSDDFLDYYHNTPSVATTLEDISIWQGGEDSPAHIYTQTVGPSLTQHTLSSGVRDSSAARYGPIYAEMARLYCPFVHIDIPLMEPPPSIDNQGLLNNSIIIISSLHRGPSRLLTEVYSQGTRVSSCEVQMKEHAHPDGSNYSAPLPQDLIDYLCKEVSSGDRESANQDTSAGKDFLDNVAMLRFIQQKNSSEEGKVTELVIAAEFHAVNGSSPVNAKISSHSIADDASPESHFPSTSHPPPRAKELAASSRVPRRARLLSRPMPKLSVAIPPTNVNRANGVLLCTDSPESAVRPTPRTGIPSNVGPVTPIGQLIHTPISPPPLSQSSARSRSKYAPTPSESSYPFTFSSMSPWPEASPMVGALDSSMGSAPAWLTQTRHVTPFTPSFFMQYPHTATASNAMSSFTERAIDAGTPAVSRRDDYFSQPLASPLAIASGTTFSDSQKSVDPFGPPNVG